MSHHAVSCNYISWSVKTNGVMLWNTHHSSSSTLKVLALENMLSYAPIRVKTESTGHSLRGVNATFNDQGILTHLAFFAGTSMPS